MKCLIYFILYDWYSEPSQGSLLINSVLPEPLVEAKPIFKHTIIFHKILIPYMITENLCSCIFSIQHPCGYFHI